MEIFEGFESDFSFFLGGRGRWLLVFILVYCRWLLLSTMMAIMSMMIIILSTWLWVMMILSLMNYCSCLRFLFFLGVERNQGLNEAQYSVPNRKCFRFGWWVYTLPETNISLKIGGFEDYFPFLGRHIFRDYVKLWGGKSLIKKWVKVVKTNYTTIR